MPQKPGYLGAIGIGASIADPHREADSGNEEELTAAHAHRNTQYARTAQHEPQQRTLLCRDREEGPGTLRH